MADMEEKIRGVLEVLPGVISDLKSNSHVLSKFGISVTPEVIKKLEEVKEKLEFFKNKFEKDIIEVAFVGLEKAGKSTLVNAIIGKSILPSDYKRATYTTTQVEYSPENYLEVFFYEEEEFLNEVYRKMLKDVEYPEAERQTLDSVSLADFERYFEGLKNTDKRYIYDKYKGNLENDIKETIEGKEKIKRYLRGRKERIPFSKIDEYRDYIVDKHISRAVKEIKIYTDALRGLENVIIYDLPGFDSPTFTHSKFTKEKIRKADAVVFVREAENPSIRRAEVEIINETREEDGTLLKDKAFFFCNMVDKLPNRKDLERVQHDFMEELTRHDIYKKQERIIYGSALAKLQELGVYEESNAINGLRKLELDHGIETLLDRLKHYNKTERREVLYRRINHLLGVVEEEVQRLEEEISKKKRHSSAVKVFAQKLKEIEEKVKRSILDNIDDFHRDVKEINRTKELSRKISETVREGLVFDSLVSNEEKESVKRDINLKTSTFEEKPIEYNIKLRDKLYVLVLDKFTKTIEESVREKLLSISNDLKEKFVKAFEVSPDKREKFLEILEKHFEKMGVNFSYEVIGLKKFIERFGGDLIQLLITNPVGSPDREGKFKEIERDIYSLMAYDENFNPDFPIDYKSLKLRLLYQQGDLVQEHTIEEVRRLLSEVLKSKNITFGKGKEDYMVSLLLNKFSLGKIKEMLNTIKHLPYVRSYEDMINYINNTTPDKEEFQIDKIKNSSTYEEVEKEISKDVDILREMLERNVIKAIGLERMIVNHITSQIQTIKNWVSEMSTDFHNFISENIDLIAKDVETEIAMLSAYEGVMSRLSDGLDKLLKTLTSGGR
ncbi:MAG: dynamin family protein [Aquificaceae bacterium]|nr:dynamin family protein [Aquificaceae bacterium]